MTPTELVRMAIDNKNIDMSNISKKDINLGNGNFKQVYAVDEQELEK